jgi:hypothetical protein
MRTAGKLTSLPAKQSVPGMPNLPQAHWLSRNLAKFKTFAVIRLIAVSLCQQRAFCKITAADTELNL